MRSTKCVIVHARAPFFRLQNHRNLFKFNNLTEPYLPLEERRAPSADKDGKRDGAFQTSCERLWRTGNGTFELLCFFLVSENLKFGLVFPNGPRTPPARRPPLTSARLQLCQLSQFLAIAAREASRRISSADGGNGVGIVSSYNIFNVIDSFYGSVISSKRHFWLNFMVMLLGAFARSLSLFPAERGSRARRKKASLRSANIYSN